MIAIEPCTEESVKYVAAHLTVADELEVMTAGGMAAEKAIQWGQSVSSDSFAVHPMVNGIAGAPVALFGIVDDGERNAGHAVIWMITTPMLYVTSRDILKEAPKWMNDWLRRFPKGLHNLVDSRNERHIRWLRKMGARFSEETTLIRGIPFHYFHIRRGDVR